MCLRCDRVAGHAGPCAPHPRSNKDGILMVGPGEFSIIVDGSHILDFCAALYDCLRSGSTIAAGPLWDPGLIWQCKRPAERPSRKVA